MLAFDVAEFFPSLNQKMLVGILCKQGFASNVVHFFSSYIVGHTTRYMWGSFVFNLQLADVRLGLALEHDRLELFHFNRLHSPSNPSLYLGYAHYTSPSPVSPKLHWLYLCIYFNCKLTFHKHIHYYSTKAFMTIKAIHMLGNSSHSLSHQHKRLINCSCVIPIATYGFQLWYFGSAKNKGAIKTLNSMQHQAALWLYHLCGVFIRHPPSLLSYEWTALEAH